MPSIANNINNNSSVVNVGRTTPVTPGQQPAARSIPVVLASDQTPVPVEEQNKVQSEVALSLLGIPRAEVALGIFADVNTYDVNPSEWSKAPAAYVQSGNFARGIKHLPNEAGALVTAGRNQNAVLTSKRFFRYQPGRVSAATFGIKTTTSLSHWAKNPSIRKFGIYDNYDGYYWENRQTGQDDNFAVVRRTQSLLKAPVSTFGTAGETLRGSNPTVSDTIKYNQLDDYRIVGKAPATLDYLAGTLFVRDRQILNDQYFALEAAVEAAVLSDYGTDGNGETYYEAHANLYNDYLTGIGSSTTVTAQSVKDKCRRDLGYLLKFIQKDLEWGGDAHVKIHLTNFEAPALNLQSSDTGITAAYQNEPFEVNFYTLLKTEITTNGASTYGLSSAAITKIRTLLDVVIAAYSGATTTGSRYSGAIKSVLAQPSAGSRDFGSRSQIDTIYDVKQNFWAYYVATYNQGTTAYAGDNGFATYQNSSGTTITNDTDIAYTSADGVDFTLAEVKYKCERDVGYVIDGFRNDISGGGDAETKYNMSMYQKGTRGYYTTEGMSIASQAISEKARHEHLKQIIQYDLVNKFGFSTGSAEYEKQTALSTRVVNNFDVEDTQSMTVGARGYAGNLVVQRDGLLMVHGGVYDTNLLKEQEAVTTLVIAADATSGSLRPNNSFELAPGKGVVTFGQHVKYVGTDNGDLVDGTIYRVKSVIGPKGNVFTLVDKDGANVEPASNATAAFVLVNPFIFPDEYDPDYYATNADPYGNARAITSDTFPKGMMFPYMYQIDQNLAADNTQPRVGYINTVPVGIASDETFAAATRNQIDKVNFIPEYINWIKNNVKPEFYGVYEYRVPRTRFSHDKLDGRNGSADSAFSMVYSDVATGQGGSRTRPGQLYNDGEPSVSLYNFDFTKVTMLKIEFSWYGAVGALFLAYVPVDNGEARWVRVHHLRASNQLKIASLGNATLPITYNVYGGGDYKNLGDAEEPGAVGATQTLADTGYGNASHSIVKYGASYYIDGGDRGTVRLYSHNNDDVVESIGKQWEITSGAYNAGDQTLLVNSTTMANSANPNVDETFFMGAKIKTDDKRDQGVYVKWVDVANNKLELSGALQNTNIRILPDRANCVYGLETKQNILSTVESNSVRNRVQVYPTKLSAANLGDNPVRLRMKKTPIFQTDVDVSGKTFTLAAQHTITSQNYPLSTTSLSPTSPPDTAPTETGGTYLQNGESIYGWFKAKLDGITDITPFGRLYKFADNYYFEVLETYNGTITLLAGAFLADGRYDADGSAYGDTRLETEKEGLSSIIIAYNTAVPIPGTGINIATLYLQQGTEQLELGAYFDYNKDYLSYPLTDVADTLYLAVDSDTPSSSNTDNISLGITWEEQ